MSRPDTQCQHEHLRFTADKMSTEKQDEQHRSKNPIEYPVGP